MLKRKTQQIALYPILLKQLFRRKNVSNKRSSSTTSEPPTKEEPSPTRRRTEHLDKASSQISPKIQVRLQTLGLLNR